jgi:hypothetical protein
MCRSVQVIGVDSNIFKKDRDKAEEIKIWTFIRMVGALTNKDIGFTLPMQEKKTAMSQVEKWPLIQAYALEGTDIQTLTF